MRHIRWEGCTGVLIVTKRLAVVLACFLAAGFATPLWGGMPAAADDSLGVANVGQSSYYALIGQGSGLNVTVFSGSGPAHGPGLQADLSALASGVTVSAEGTGCARSGSVIACDQIYQLILNAGQGSGPGQAGRITIRNATSSASITVDVMTSAQSTLAGSDVTVSAAIGDVVSVPISLRNEGPNTLYRGGIWGFAFEDNTQLVSIDGCQPGPERCLRDNFRAGTSIDITLHLRINACDIPGASGGYGLTSNPGAKFVAGRFKVKVTGCGHGSGGGTQGGQRPAGSAQATAAASESAAPTSAPSAEPSITPSAAVTSGPISAEPIVSAASGQRTSLLWPAILVTTACIVLGLLGYWRRKARSVSETPAQDVPDEA